MSYYSARFLIWNTKEFNRFFNKLTIKLTGQE